MSDQGSSQRDVYLYMVQILDQTDRHQDMVDLMKKVIDLNPELNPEERNLLSVSYKNVITVRRNGLRILLAIVDHDESRANENRINQLAKFKASLVSELDNYCYELINLVDQKLLPAAKTAEAKLFYEKLKADYYRYISEAKEGTEKEESAAKARECYENALAIAKEEIPPYKPAYLGLILNYSVYLYEIVGHKEEAIELAEKTQLECTTSVEQNSDNAYAEATTILQLLRDNVSLWNQTSQ
ncbi:14-3-3 protein [Tritrichomonas foetus]|uniref:14-3-3 protein n=1 Tax=Tritrichomonas foetus TaxID=1144522 RepID=A0A1J4KN58_9EUKA|nr:14-3-3 protein [Tritrichomonas foetus]|eukprot:OHT11134.1 14-3-3 protein [Tritrichomonas foetus]